MTLFDMLLLMLFAACCAWLWRGFGIREQALQRARQHCAQLDVELLDGNVAFQGFAWRRDGRGRRRLSRRYAFEFTVTGEQRLQGELFMWGPRLLAIELQAHPIPPEQAQRPQQGEVIDLQQWRRQPPEG